MHTKSTNAHYKAMFNGNFRADGLGRAFWRVMEWPVYVLYIGVLKWVNLLFVKFYMIIVKKNYKKLINYEETSYTYF